MALVVGRVRGIPVQLHWSFLLVLPVFAYLMARIYFSEPDGAAPDAVAWVWGSLLALGLFASVLVHEFAHSLTALRNGIKVEHITLLPIGGVSAFEETPEDPGVEFRVTVVGPLTNFAIGAPVLALWWLGLVPQAVTGLPLFAFWFGTLNLVLGGFNLFVPAFPMDGGRILRSLLVRPFGRARATRIAAGIGRGLAVLLGVWGLLVGAILLVVIAVFIYFGAMQEDRSARISESLGRYRVEDVMTRDVDVLHSEETVEDAFARMMRTKHVAFPVVSPRGDVMGVALFADLQRVPLAERFATTLDTVLQPEYPTLAPEDRATETLKLLAGRKPALVMDQQHALVGIVTPTDVARFAEIVGAGPPEGFAAFGRE